ncbi:2173_t:CDS:2, partial [Acaulospora morrowiae]
EEYFNLTPVEKWSFSGYLEAMQSFLNVDFEVSTLKSIWRKRFNDHLREISRSKNDNEKKNRIASFLINQNSKATQFWEKFKKKKMLKTRQNNTKVDIQEDESVSEMETLNASSSEDNDRNNMKRQSDDSLEQKEAKSRKTTIGILSEAFYDDDCYNFYEDKENSNPNKDRVDEHEKEDGHSHVKNLFNELQRCSDKMTNLVNSFQRYCDENINELCLNEIMDLSPTSEFVIMYTDEDDYNHVLKEMFEPIDKLIPEQAINFLDIFFSERSHDYQKWSNKLEDLLEPESDPFLKKLKRFLFETLSI